MSNRKKSLITISILSIPLSASAALIPVLASIGRAFPDWNGYLQYLVTIPPLFLMISSLLTGRFLKTFSIKTLAVFSIFLIILAGVTPYLFPNFIFLLVTRGFLGFGLGILNTIVASLPAIYFSPGEDRNRAVGLQAAFVGVGSVLFSLLSGKLALKNWQNVFLVQLINLIPLVISLIFMPTISKADSFSQEEKLSVFVKEGFSTALLSFFCIVILVTFPLNLSLFAENHNLGDAYFVGQLSSINAAIGFFIGLAFSKIFSFFKGFTLPLGLALAGIGFYVISFSKISMVLLVGSIFLGLGTSLVSPALYSHLYEKVPPHKIISAVGMLGVATNISQFLSPYIINPVARLFGNQELHRYILAGTLILSISIFFTLKKLLVKKIII